MTGECHHHHGTTIRDYRTLRGWTQTRLAERWPHGAVSAQYVQRVESGKKHIADPETLRGLSELLEIPLWQFGLSEYDPFHPHNLPGQGARMYQETLDAVECLIRQSWELRRAALMLQAERALARLNALFAHFNRELAPPSRLAPRFLSLYAQALRLDAVAAVERQEYARARRLYQEMIRVAGMVEDSGTQAIAMMSLGSELMRADHASDGLDALERARDRTFGANNKAVAAFVHSYLARGYAMTGDETRFERACATARTLVDGVGEAYGDGEDFIYAGPSSVLAEMSWGYLLLGKPDRTLDVAEDLSQLITRDRDHRLRAWIPLDWARAHLRLGEVEAAVSHAERFLHLVVEMESAHALRQARRLLREFADAGYGDTAPVHAYAASVRTADAPMT